MLPDSAPAGRLHAPHPSLVGAWPPRLVGAASLVGAAFTLLLAQPRPARADAAPPLPQACQLERVRVLGGGAGAGAHEVRIETGCTPTFTTLHLSDPPRVVVDVAHGAIGGLSGAYPIDDGAITEVVLQQYGSAEVPVGRIQVGLSTDAPCEVVRDGQAVVIRTAQAAPLAQQLARPRAFVPANPLPPADDVAAPPDTDAADASGAARATEALGLASAAPTTGSNAPNGDGDAATARDAQPGRRPALVGVRGARGGAVLKLGATPSFHTTRLTGPDRLVVDIPGATARARRVRLRRNPAWLRQIRLGRAEGALRVVFDLARGATPEVLAHPEGLWVGPAAAPSAAVAPAAQAAPPLAHGRLTALQVHHATVQGRRQTRVFLATEGDVHAEVDTRNPRAFIVALKGAELPEHLEQTLDTRAKGGVVSLLSAFQAQREPAQVQVVASLVGRAQQTLTRVPGGLSWQFDELAAEGSVTGAAASRAFPRTAGFAADAPAPGESAGTGAAMRNHRISLDVKDADIINVLRLISEETGENIIASDEVKGRITLKLRNVPAEQALDTVLRLKGFDRVRQNNILRIASAESIQKERDLEVARKRALIEVEEVGIKMVTINYATAAEVVEQLKPMLSGRGSLQVDARTNTLIIQDVASNVDRLTELAHRLDKQTPLVNIQARIVEASSSFARDLGVQWGGAAQHTARTGNPTGVYFPADITASGAADLPVGNQATGVVNPARYAVNFPATLDGKGAGLGFVLGSAGGAQLLDLRLSAMESNGNGKIISSPEVSTLDNKTARVSQGMEIPVSTTSAAGTNTRFVPAVLELEVTPHVTNDGTVLMKIHVQKSAADFTRLGGQGDPTINKRQAETEVLVRDGDTSVIGGILTRETTDTRSEVPFLARIPILGNLFRRHQSGDTRAELLVFITPRIINREASTVQSGSVFDRTNN